MKLRVRNNPKLKEGKFLLQDFNLESLLQSSSSLHSNFALSVACSVSPKIPSILFPLVVPKIPFLFLACKSSILFFCITASTICFSCLLSFYFVTYIIHCGANLFLFGGRQKSLFFLVQLTAP